MPISRKMDRLCYVYVMECCIVVRMSFLEVQINTCKTPPRIVSENKLCHIQNGIYRKI